MNELENMRAEVAEKSKKYDRRANVASVFSLASLADLILIFLLACFYAFSALVGSSFANDSEQSRRAVQNTVMKWNSVFAIMAFIGFVLAFISFIFASGSFKPVSEQKKRVLKANIQSKADLLYISGSIRAIWKTLINCLIASCVFMAADLLLGAYCLTVAVGAR